MGLKKIVIVTGVSGAGKTTTLQCLEDIGYLCIDNIPLYFISQILATFTATKNELEKIAFGVNILEPYLIDHFEAVLETLNSQDYIFKVIFLDADDQVILRRFSETRRRHPLNKENQKTTVLSNILEERDLLEAIKDKADKVINSSNLNAQKLKEMIKHLFLTDKNSLMINLVSFGFKYGVPLDSDMTFDVRFLANPYYDPVLKPLTGNDPKIQNFVMETQAAQTFFNKLKDLFDFLIPEFEKEGKTYLTIGIGCTGGKHRSVTILNQLKDYMHSKGFNVGVVHRDILK
ncbi:MAG: RNase adapter RapZ [bacterium]|nr:RNase adapter RapZ [bacterium]